MTALELLTELALFLIDLVWLGFEHGYAFEVPPGVFTVVLWLIIIIIQ